MGRVDKTINKPTTLKCETKLTNIYPQSEVFANYFLFSHLMLSVWLHTLNLYISFPGVTMAVLPVFTVLVVYYFNAYHIIISILTLLNH